MLRSLKNAAVCAIVLSTPAYATTLSGTFSGTIAAPSNTGGSDIRHSEGGENVLYWGAIYVVPPEPNEGASSLTVVETEFSADITESQTIRLGTIEWLNRANWISGPEWDSSLTLTLDFALPDDLAPLTQTVDFRLEEIQDPHDSDKTALENVNTNEESGNNPDFIKELAFDTGAFDVPLFLGSGLYLTNVFFDFEGSTNGESSYDPETGTWQNSEGTTSVIGIYGDISAVPLPAGLWLMLSGLGGLLVMKRRNQATA